MTVPLGTLLVRPREAFADGDLRPLLPPALVVFATGVTSIGAVLPIHALLRPELPADVPTVAFAVGGSTVEIARPFAVGMVLALALSAVFWLLYAALVHVGARLAGGSGSFRGTLALVGWSNVPNLVVMVLAVLLGIALAAVRPVTVTEVLHGPDPLSTDGLLLTMDGEGLIDSRSPLSHLGTLWVGYVWYGGLRVAHDLPRRSAAQVAGGLTLSLLVLFAVLL